MSPMAPAALLLSLWLTAAPAAATAVYIDASDSSAPDWRASAASIWAHAAPPPASSLQAGRAAPSPQARPAPAAKFKMATVPEPRAYSMMLIGAVLLALRLRQEPQEETFQIE